MRSLKTITYYPCLRDAVGSVNAAILVAHLEGCFKEKGKIFYKFMESCNHGAYVEGTSWVEELQMTTTEFRTAFRHIGVVYKSKKEYNLSKDKFQGKMYLSYYDRISKLTYYMRNDDLVTMTLLEIGLIKEGEGKSVATTEVEEIKLQDTITKESGFIEPMTSSQDGELRNEEIKDGIKGYIDYKSSDTKTNKSLTNGSIMTKTNKDNTNTDIKTKTKNNNNTDIQTKTYEQRNPKLEDAMEGASAITKPSSNLENSKASKVEKHMNPQRDDGLQGMSKEEKVDGETRKQDPYVSEQEDKEVPYGSIRQLFNQICQSHAQIVEWTSSQKQKLGQLWWCYDGKLETFKRAFEKLEESDFLSGRSKSWKAQLDWIFKPEHFADILGDKYRNFKALNKQMSKVEKEESDDRWDFEEIERLEAARIDKILEGI